MRLRAPARAPRATRRSALRSSPRTAATSPASSIAPASHARAGSWKIVRPTAKPRHVVLAARRAKPARQRVDGARSGRAARRRGSTDRARRSARRSPATAPRDIGVELPPLGIDAEVVEALHRAQHACPAPRGRRFGGMISSSSSWPLACTASYSARICASSRARLSTSSSGWNGTRHLTTCSTRPARRASCRSSGRGRTRRGFEPGSSTGRPIHQPRPVAALSASWP